MPDGKSSYSAPSSGLARRALGVCVWGLLLVSAASVAQNDRPASPPAAGEGAAQRLSPAPLDPVLEGRGRKLYGRFCVSCHGEAGDGRGESAQWLEPRPRDFTRAVFKCRSTPSGTLPTDDDLFRTLNRGLHGTQMPNWSILGEPAQQALVAYLKTFSPRWIEEPPGAPIAVAPEPADEPASRARGEALWTQLACANCHGQAGNAWHLVHFLTQFVQQ